MCMVKVCKYGAAVEVAIYVSAESAVVLRSELTTRVTLTFSCTDFRIFLQHEPQLIIPLYGMAWK